MVNLGIAILMIFVWLIGDFLWFDHDNKRWGWTKNWSKPIKVTFFY